MMLINSISTKLKKKNNAMVKKILWLLYIKMSVTIQVSFKIIIQTFKNRILLTNTQKWLTTQFLKVIQLKNQYNII